MRRLNKIVALISLLSNRHHVSMETITSVCGISERSAYRYLNFISEANFPVFYDKKLGAYRLAEQNTKLYNRPSIEDIILTVIGLKMLSQKLNNHYRADVDELIRRLVAEKSFPLEEVIQSFNNQLEKADRLEDCTELVSSMLLNAAITGKRKIRILIENSATGEKAVDLNLPSLTFRKVWRLVNAQEIGSDETSLSEVTKVSIV